MTAEEESRGGLKRYTRREVLPILAGATLGLITSPNLLEARKYSPTSLHLNSLPEQGTVVITTQGQPFLIRELSNAGMVLIPDKDRYIEDTQPEQHGRKIIPDVGSDIINKYKAVRLAVSPEKLLMADPLTGELKHIRRFGGRILVFFGGFSTENGNMPTLIDPSKQTFGTLMNALKPLGWQLEDSSHSTYGRRGLNSYRSADTAKPPEQNIKASLDDVKIIQETYLLAQIIAFGHSLGAEMASKAVMAYPHLFDKVFLFCGPVRGIEETPERRLIMPIVRAALMAKIGTTEYVSQYFFNKWEDENDHREIDNFGRSFMKDKRRIWTFYGDGDQIVPPESTYVERALRQSVAVESLPLWRLFFAGGEISIIKQILAAHGQPLKDEQVLKFVTDEVGRNLAGRT